MKFSRLGVTFKYYGDQITWHWPWVRKHLLTYYSTIYTRDFNSFNEYWEMVGQEAALLKSAHQTGRMYGFDLMAVICRWSARLWPGEFLVVMKEVEVGRKGPAFWSRLSTKQREALTEDIVILRCDSKSEVYELIDSIEPSFASAYGVLNGQIIISNDIHDWESR